MNKSTRNVKVFALILLTSALLILAINPSIPRVKATTQDSLYVYTSCGGTMAADGTNLTGGSTYTYANGTAITFTAFPITGCTLLCWEVATASGAITSTTNPFIYTISSSEAAIQALYLPTVNASLTSTSTKTGTVAFDVLISVGELQLVPAAGVYTNYTIGSVVSFTATAGSGFKFLYWIIPSASGGASVSTDNPLSYKITANTGCGIQAMFIPTSSTVTLPKISTINEFSSATAIIMVTALVIVAFGTYAYTRAMRERN